MPSLPYDNRNFSRGFNSKTSATLLDDVPGSPQARDLLNVQGTVGGAIVKRGGLVTSYSPADTLTSLVVAASVKNNGGGPSDPGMMVGAGGTKLYSFDPGGAVATIKTGLTSGLRWEFINMPAVSSQGPLFGMNGTDTPQFWDGSAATGNWTNASGSVHVPNGTMVVQWQNQAYVAGTTTTPTGMSTAPDPGSRLYWSAIGDPTNWDQASNTGAGFVDFDPQDGAAISGLGVVGPYLLVFKPTKTWVVIQPGASGVTSTQIRQISDSIGCLFHRSIASGSAGTYFLSEDRVYLTNGSKLTSISDIIQPTIDQGDGSIAAGMVYKKHYYLSLLGALPGTANDIVLDWDETLQSWWKHSFGSSQFAAWDFSQVNGNVFLYSAKSTAAIVDRCFVGGAYQDNGSNFQWYWKGPWQSPSFVRRRFVPTTFYRKRLRQVRIEGSGTVDYSLAYDVNPAQTLISQDVFNNSSTQAEDIEFSLGVGRAFSQIFSATSSTAGEVDSYTMFVTDRKDRMVS